MKREVLVKYITALFSNRYKHCMSWLRVHDGYSALGVLCDIAGKENIGEWKSYGNNQFYSYEGYTERIPLNVVNWSGMSDKSMDDILRLERKGATMEDIAVWLLESNKE